MPLIESSGLARLAPGWPFLVKTALVLVDELWMRSGAAAADELARCAWSDVAGLPRWVTELGAGLRASLAEAWRSKSCASVKREPEGLAEGVWEPKEGSSGDWQPSAPARADRKQAGLNALMPVVESTLSTTLLVGAFSSAWLLAVSVDGSAERRSDRGRKTTSDQSVAAQGESKGC